MSRRSSGAANEGHAQAVDDIAAPVEDPFAFDEVAYLERYVDVAQEVARGGLASGRAHFEAFGRAEGRVARSLNLPPSIDIPASSRVDSFTYPAFQATPPVLVDADRMPADLRASLTALWTQAHPEREASCHVLDDAVVAGAGLVFDNSGRLYQPSAYQTSKRQIEAAAADVRVYLAEGSGRAIGGTTLLCEKIGAVNFGHWLVEMAPLAFALRKRLADDWYLRAPFVEGNPAMCGIIRDSLESLGIDPTRLRWGLGSVPQRYRHLAFVRDFSHHGSYYSPFAPAAFEAMAASVPGFGARKVWVSRSGLERRLSDEDALITALSARGWMIAETGAMTLRRQISLFKDAEVIAGVAGAGLTHIGFAPRGARVVAFVPDRMPDIFFWALARMKDQRFVEIRCPQEHGDTRPFHWDGLLIKSADDALAQLDEALARA